MSELRKIIREELKLDPAIVGRTQRERDTAIRSQAETQRKRFEQSNYLREWETFEVGDWVRLKDGTIGQIKKFIRHEQTSGRPEFVSAYIVTHLGYNMEQRAEIILGGAREATTDEREKAVRQGEEERARVAGEIDTSREGT